MKVQQPGKATPINSNRQLDNKEFYQAIQKYGDTAKSDGAAGGSVAQYIVNNGGGLTAADATKFATQLSKDNITAGTFTCSALNTAGNSCINGNIYDSSKSSTNTTSLNYASNCCKSNYTVPTVDGTVCKLEPDITISSITYHMVSCKVNGVNVNGSITFNSSATADILVIAGGGGGSADYYGGGGGAGGVQYFSAQNLSATNYPIKVGKGGAIDTNGETSKFGTLSDSIGGGHGAGSTSVALTTGGSGGGGKYNSSSQNLLFTTGQGYAGGYGNMLGPAPGGGGGGNAIKLRNISI